MNKCLKSLCMIMIVVSLISYKVSAEEKKIDNNKMKPEEKLKNETIGNKEHSGNTVVIQTDKGSIKIKLFVKDAPNTTSNFIDLVKKGFYNSTVFHRVVENFVIQGGDPLGDGTGSYVDPQTNKPRYLKLETNPKLKFDQAGRVGMARSRAADSASCQFFIALQALPSLDPGGVDENGYAVFGQVTEDTMKTVREIVKYSRPAFPGSDRPANPVRMQSVVLE